ncbi:MAG: helix-turn-helix domain-containing protein [Chloroflexi bacterium]|nr:helix-turn-helix domain-containing protein [Chloroflexota bacterium]
MPDRRTPVPDAEIFGKFLEHCRRDKGLTLEDVARRAGVSKQFVHDLLKSKPNTGLAKAMRVASEVGLTLYSHRRPPGVTVPQRKGESEPDPYAEKRRRLAAKERESRQPDEVSDMLRSIGIDEEL